MKFYLRVVLILVVLVAAASLQPAPVQAQSPATWTIMFYSTADTSDIEAGMMLDINEVEFVGSSDQIQFVAQIDRTTADPTWTDARRLLLMQDVDWRAVNSPVIASLGEVNQGDPQSLVDFVLWATSAYPADHYALILSDHGGGWTGFGWDLTNNNDPLYMLELDQAFSTITSTLGYKLDLIGFDACLMSQFDVIKLLAPYADYAILSEELEPAYGWAYDISFNKLFFEPAMSPAELGTEIVKDYVYSYAEGEWATVGFNRFDLSLIDLSQYDAAEEAMLQFIGVVGANSSDVLRAIGVARNNVLYFGGTTPDEADYFSSVDLVHFLSLLINVSDNGAVNQAAQDLINATEDLVVYHESSSALSDSHGVAVYFPANNQVYQLYGGANAYPQMVPYMSEWQNFLGVYYGTATAMVPVLPTEEALSITGVYPGEVASIYHPPVIVFSTDAQDIVEVSFSATLMIDEYNLIMLDESPLESAEVGADGEELIDFPDGFQMHEYTWGAEMPVITDGVVAIPTLLLSDREVEDVVYISGEYIPQGGEPLTAYLAADLNTRSVIGVWAISGTGSTPFSLTPNPGDHFLPTWRYLDANGAYEFLPASSDPLTFGSEPFSYYYEPAISGDYILNIRMEDIAGNIYLSSTVITIDNEGLDVNYRGYTDITMGISFLYPWDWPSPTFYLDDEGSYQAVLSDEEGNSNLYIIAYEGASDEDAYYTLLDYVDWLDVDDLYYDETVAEELDVYGYPATLIPYSFSSDGEGRFGMALGVYIPDLATTFIVDMDVTEPMVEEGMYMLNTVIGSMTFFSPPEIE